MGGVDGAGSWLVVLSIRSSLKAIGKTGLTAGRMRAVLSRLAGAAEDQFWKKISRPGRVSLQGKKRTWKKREGQGK